VKIRLSKNRLSVVEMVGICLLAAAYLIPRAALGSTVLLGVLLAYSCYIALLDWELRPVVFKIMALTALLALVYALLTDASSIAQDVSNRGFKRFFSKTYQYYTLYFPAILFLRVNHAGSRIQKRILLIFSIGLMVYVAANTRLYLITHPGAIRSWSGEGDLESLNIAGYYHIIAYPILVAVVAACLVRLKPVYRMVVLIAIVMTMEFIIASQYTLSLLIAIIGICYQIGITIRTRVWRIIYAMLMLVLAAFIPEFLRLGIRLIPSEQVTIRLGEILAFLSGQGADGYNLNSRLTLYGRSILAFLTSPIWGNRKLGFDGHATFLTVLADTGLLGGIPFYYLLTLVVKQLRNTLNEHGKQIRTVILVVALTGLTNPIHASQPFGMAAWFIAPMLITAVFKERKNGKETL